MFDIGFWELSLIFVVALLVVGPQRLPGLVRSTAYWFSRVRQMTNDVKTEISMELDKAEQLKKLMEEQADVVRRTEEEFNRSLNEDIEKAGKLDPADSAGGRLRQQQAESEQSSETKPLESDKPLETVEKEPEQAPVRARPVPASMTPPRPVDRVAAVEPVAEKSDAAVKDEPKS